MAQLIGLGAGGGIGGAGGPGVEDVDPVEDCPGSGVVGGILVLNLALSLALKSWPVGNDIVAGC
jgi:hypothetical protein